MAVADVADDFWGPVFVERSKLLFQIDFLDHVEVASAVAGTADVRSFGWLFQRR